jgi:hypothetical protein
MPVVAIIVEAIALIQHIREISQGIEDGNESCKFLAERVLSFTEPLNKLSSLKGVENDSTKIRAVETFLGVVKECESFIKGFLGKGWALRIALVSRDNSRIKDLHDKLSTVAAVSTIVFFEIIYC